MRLCLVGLWGLGIAGCGSSLSQTQPAPQSQAPQARPAPEARQEAPRLALRGFAVDDETCWERAASAQGAATLPEGVQLMLEDGRWRILTRNLTTEGARTLESWARPLAMEGRTVQVQPDGRGVLAALCLFPDPIFGGEDVASATEIAVEGEAPLQHFYTLHLTASALARLSERPEIHRVLWVDDDDIELGISLADDDGIVIENRGDIVGIAGGPDIAQP